MSTLRRTGRAIDWSTIGGLAMIAVSKMLTALVLSSLITLLVRHIFAGEQLRFLFGAEGFSYWRCVGLYFLWFAVRMKINISGSARIEIEGDR